MQQQCEDSLQLSQQPNIISQLEPKQQIKFSILIKKINEDKMVQERIFLLTSHSIYNIAKRSGIIKSLVSKLITLNSKYTIKRKIPLKQIYGITLSNSKQNGQFVLHVIDDYDYRYCADSHQKKVLILKKICQIYSLNNNGKKLPFYIKDQIVLIDYATRKCDLKNKVDKKPKQDPVFLGQEDFEEYQLPDLNYKLQFSLFPENNNVIMKQFKPIFEIEQFQSNHKYFSVSNGNLDLKFLMDIANYESSIFLKPEFIFSTKSKIQILTPFMIGGNLSRKLKQSVRISQELAWFYIAQLIVMLEELQQKSICYPNFCLQNIYISDNGYLKLMAVQKDISSKPNAYKKVHYDILGHPQYVAPQMILVKGYKLMEVNLWKLGICAHYLLFGSYPFEGSTTKQIYYSIMTKKLKPETPEFLCRLLNRNPKNRISLEQLKQHPKLTHINWKQLKQQLILAPYQPDISSWKGNLPTIVQFNKQGSTSTLK